MKFNQYLWNLYKSSSEGVQAIAEFTPARELDQDIEIIERYIPDLIKNDRQRDYVRNILEDMWMFKIGAYPEDLELNSTEEAEHLFENIISSGLSTEGEVIFKPGDYLGMIDLIPFLSIELNVRFRYYFFPYLYLDRFYELKKLADLFDIEFPPVPKKPDHKGRCMYYWELCKIFHRFRIANGMNPEELCAFLYDFAPNLIQKEEKGEIPQPSQAWFIGGLIQGYGNNWTTGFWQSNIETKKGDILIHYETSPVSAITCLWIAQVDGVIDPFFRYYSNTYIGNKIDIPHITLKELKTDRYFKNHPLVRKSFQGVNGWPVTGDDYSELLRMIQSKGFDTSRLPRLYAPSISKDIKIETERDVEKKLLEPLLNSMGLHENSDFIRQLPIHAGRGHRIYPDYALHYDIKPDEERATVLIEAKLYMKNNQEVEDAFLQARSYAMLLDSSVIILCDRNTIIAYEKAQSFDRDRYIKYYWEELNNTDIFNRLKSKLLTHNI